jgi:phosphatidylserine/phosphatidylglycerophosphate/cardiolipin synthase-like enzyme
VKTVKYDVLLSDGARNNLREAVKDILSREKNYWRIRILTLNFSDVELSSTTLREIIKRHRNKGAKITVVVGSKPEEKDKDFYEELLDEGVEIFFNDKVHAKVILAEEKSKASALIMSANLTRSGLYYNYEAGVLVPSLKRKDYNNLREYTSNIIGAPIKTKPIEMVI